MVSVELVVLLAVVAFAAYAITAWVRRPFWAIAACVCVLAGLSWLTFRYPLDGYLAVSFAIGASVGAAEVISRYRDEPFIALFANAYGRAYMGINGLAAVAAYGTLSHFGDRILVGVGSDPILRTMAAGFGSSLLFRSKFFNLRSTAGDEVGVGPDAVISTLLRCVDRGVDRARSARRQRIVYQVCARIELVDIARATPFLRSAIASFQNLSDAEKKEFDTIVSRVADEKGDPRLTLMLICFAFLNISGEENFEALMSDLKSYLALPRPAPPP